MLSDKVRVGVHRNSVSLFQLLLLLYLQPLNRLSLHFKPLTRRNIHFVNLLARSVHTLTNFSRIEETLFRSTLHATIGEPILIPRNGQLADVSTLRLTPQNIRIAHALSVHVLSILNIPNSTAKNPHYFAQLANLV